MSFEIPKLMIGELTAAADLSAKQFFAVKVDSNGQIALTVAGECAVGILQNKPTSGQAAEVMILGVSKMSAGGSISKGALVTSDANGQAAAATTGRTDTSDGGAANDPLKGSNVLGYALEAASAQNQIIAVALLHLGAVPQTLL